MFNSLRGVLHRAKRVARSRATLTHLRSNKRNKYAILGLLGASLVVITQNTSNSKAETVALETVLSDEEKARKMAAIGSGKIKEGLPYYTKEDIAQHNAPEKGIWVRYGDAVYDITNFVEVHPGGKKILMASGGSLEPFWAIYGIHKTPEVYEILEKLRIGNFKKIEGEKEEIDQNDPYAREPERHPALVVRSKKPFNAETPAELLTEMITPNDVFYVRNHLPVPVIDINDYRLKVTCPTCSTLNLTLDDLKKNFPKYDVVATIQCAGNRRNEMTTVKEVKGLGWDFGAISTAKWSGARLRDILLAIGVPDDGKGFEHVHLEGLDRDFEKFYGASIPIGNAMDPLKDVLIAYEMNDTEIPRDHGYPVRAIVPGTVGARNVKWLNKIEPSLEESMSHWQRKDYKGFCPSENWESADFTTAIAIQELPVQSTICEPKTNTELNPEESTFTVKGYSWSGGGRGIVRVDVSMDGGKLWRKAELQLPPNQPYNRVWAWTPWEVTLPVPENNSKEKQVVQLVCKAVDSSYNVQPDTVAPIWNIRGVLTNSWHRVNVTVPPSKKQ